MKLNLEQLIEEHAQTMAEQMHEITGFAETEEDVRLGVTKLIDEFITKAGIKVRGRTERDIADMHSLPPDRIAAKAWANPDRNPFDPQALSDAELKGVVEGREALALFGWKPYMHNPRLKNWLHRIDKPTQIVWGESDRIVTPEYGKGWTAEIDGARLDVIADCGHYPAWEQPEEFANRVAAFAQ